MRRTCPRAPCSANIPAAIPTIAEIPAETIIATKTGGIPIPDFQLPQLGPAKELLDGASFLELLDSLAGEIDRTVPRDVSMALVGIQRRGDAVAAELASRMRRPGLVVGSLDITLYRDDFAEAGTLPLVGASHIPGSIDGAHVVIVDDVIFTGRTIRAAMDELSDFGRPGCIELAVAVNRAGRQLPIQPNYAGIGVELGPGEQVAVLVPRVDGRWGAEILGPLT